MSYLHQSFFFLHLHIDEAKKLAKTLDKRTSNQNEIALTIASDKVESVACRKENAARIAATRAAALHQFIT